MSRSRDLAAVPSAPALAPIWSRLAASPYAYDLYQLLRWLDARGAPAELLGRAGRPGEECLRLGQEPSMAFAPSTLASVRLAAEGRPPKLAIYSFGLFGANGPLPLHLTEYARDRQRNHADTSLSAFADIFHHRLILLFYRAWADAQPTASLDRPDDARFDRYVASLIHLGLPAQRRRDSVPDHARCYYAGHQVRLSRNPEGLVQMLSGYLQIPVALQEYQPRWLAIHAEDRTRLGQPGPGLAGGALLGLAVLDVQSSFRLRLGALDWVVYRQYLPRTPGMRLVLDWVRHYLGRELHWDLCLVLRAEQVPAARLDGACALGWGSWLGQRLTAADAEDLVFCPEDWIAVRSQAPPPRESPRRPAGRQPAGTTPDCRPVTS